MDTAGIILDATLLIMVVILRVELWTAQAKIKALEDRSNARPHAEARSADSVQADVRLCFWTWDESERRWMTECGYAFEERRSDHADTSGEWHPFPFCPYCGAQIRKPNT